MKEVLVDIRVRLEAAADDVDDCRSRLKHALALRDQLVVDAIEDGLSYGEVAKRIRVRKGAVSYILAGSQPDAQ